MTEELQAEPREERQIYDPIVETPTSYLREPEGAHPPLDSPGYKSTSLRHPKQPLVYLPQTITEITGPQLGPMRDGRDRQRPHGPARRRADRRADHRLGPRLRHRGQAAARHARRDLAGERGRPLPAPLGPVAGAAGSQLHRRRALRHRRRGPLPVHDDQAGRRTRGATTTTRGARPTSTSRCSAGRSPSGSSPRCTSRATRSSPTTRSSTRSAIRGRASG